jgi:hypothetical protein
VLGDYPVINELMNKHTRSLLTQLQKTEYSKFNRCVVDTQPLINGWHTVLVAEPGCLLQHPGDPAPGFRQYVKNRSMRLVLAHPHDSQIVPNGLGITDTCVLKIPGVPGAIGCSCVIPGEILTVLKLECFKLGVKTIDQLVPYVPDVPE